MDFVTELRKAHLVLTAHKLGIHSIQGIARNTHLAANEVAEWLTLFKLPHVHSTFSGYRFPYEATATVNQLNREGNHL